MDRRGQNSDDVKSGVAISSATRPRFRERQVLRADDLEAEQSYLLAARRRHNLAHHGWGIVSGLEVAKTPDGIAVQPGFAVDGYGRELIISTPLVIPAEVFIELDSEALDLWLCYDTVEMNVRQRGSSDCGPGRNTRVREVSRVRLTAAAKLEPRHPGDPRTPAEVPFQDLTFSAHQIPPDDPAREWPVYLGTIFKQGGKTSYDRKSPRPYGSLTGELVLAPSGRARMQVGSELEGDSRRFGVSVADASGEFTERLAVDRSGNTVVTGNTTIGIEADATIVRQKAAEAEAKRLASGRPAAASGTTVERAAASRLVMRPPPGTGQTQTTEPLCGAVTRTNGETPGAARMINFQPLAVTPAAAAPWQIYRTAIKQDKRTIRQLRIEIGHPGDKGDPKLWKLTIGAPAISAPGDPPDFKPLLTVSADCTVTIEGNVNVAGELQEGPIQADPSDPRFAPLIASQWVQGTVIGEVAAAPGSIHATVKDEIGGVVPGAAAKIENAALGLKRVAVTDVRGEFTTPNLPAGRYTVSIVATGFDPEVTTVNLAVGQKADIPITLKVPPGTIQGTVQDGHGAVIAQALVEIKNVTTNITKTVSTSGEGRYVAPNTPAGRYTVGVVAPGFVPQVKDVELTSGETISVDFTMQIATGTGTIQGIVTDPDGPIGGATVEATNVAASFTRTVLTNPKGRFTFPSVPTGSCSVRIADRPSTPQVVDLKLDQVVELALSPN